MNDAEDNRVAGRKLFDMFPRSLVVNLRLSARYLSKLVESLLLLGQLLSAAREYIKFVRHLEWDDAYIEAALKVDHMNLALTSAHPFLPW